MKKIFFLIMMLLCLPFVVNAEELKIEWQNSWGGDDDERFYNFLQTSDGGFIALGYSESIEIEGLPNKGFNDAIIVKYDKDGNMLWQTSWGGNSYDSFTSLLQTSDGGFIACGYSHSTDIEGLPNKGEEDAIIVKYDNNGNMLWQTSWGGAGDDYADNLLQTSDGGFIVYGESESTDIEGLSNKGYFDLVIVKYDNNGNMLWQTSWGGNSNEYWLDILQTKDDGLIIFGNTDSTDIEGLSNKGYEDIVIVKYDKDGKILWQTSWGGNGSDKLDASHEPTGRLLLTDDEGFIVFGESGSTDIEGLPNKGHSDAIILKYDKNGELLWQTSWGGNGNDKFDKMLQTLDGGFIVSGSSSSTDIEGLPNKGRVDAIIVKYDKDGNMLWQKNWGANYVESFEEILLTNDGGFIVTFGSGSIFTEGMSDYGYSNTLIVKYDKDGNIMWQQYCGKGYAFELTNMNVLDNNIIIFGMYYHEYDGEYYSNRDIIIFKLNDNGEILWQSSWGGNDYDVFSNIIQTSEGGFIATVNSRSTDIEGLPNKGSFDAIIVKYLIEYELESIVSENGTSTIEQQGKHGIVNPVPNKGYEVDKIIIKDKDGNVLDVEVAKLEDGTYSFELYTDVSVEVTFKEVLFNPKTGDVNYKLCFYVMIVLSVFGFGYLYLFRRNSVL